MVMFSDFRRFDLVDRSGRRARLIDLAIDLSAGDYPPVTAIMLRQGAARVVLGWEEVRNVAWRSASIEIEDLSRVRPADQDAAARAVLLKRDVLDALVLDLARQHAVLVNDLWLQEQDGHLSVRAADTGPWAVVRRFGRGWFGRGVKRNLLDWQDVEFLRGDPAAARSGHDNHRRVTRLQPAEIAHLSEALPYLHAAELLALIPDQLRADVLEAMLPARQLQVFEELTEDEALGTLPLMAPDVAVDLLGRLDPDLTRRYLERLPGEQRDRLVELLRYPEDTAGGIMTNDVPVIGVTLTVGEARKQLVSQLTEPDFVYYVYVVDDNDPSRLRGILTLRDLLVADDEQRVDEIMRTDLITIHPLEPAIVAARRVAENHLAALPVVGKDRRLVGAITSDAALAQIAPPAWRDQAPRVFS
jgi:CBS domain-containing protein